MLTHNKTKYSHNMCWCPGPQSLRFIVRRPEWHRAIHDGNEYWHVATIKLSMGAFYEFEKHGKAPVTYKLVWVDAYALKFPENYRHPTENVADHRNYAFASHSLTYLMKEVEFIATRTFFTRPEDRTLKEVEFTATRTFFTRPEDRT